MQMLDVFVIVAVTFDAFVGVLFCLLAVRWIMDEIYSGLCDERNHAMSAKPYFDQTDALCQEQPEPAPSPIAKPAPFTSPFF